MQYSSKISLYNFQSCKKNLDNLRSVNFFTHTVGIYNYLDVNLSAMLSAVIVNADITWKRLTEKYIPETHK